MEVIMIMVAVLLVAVLGIQVYATFFRQKEDPRDERDGLLFLQQQMEKLRDTMDRRPGEGNRRNQGAVQGQLTESTKEGREVNEGPTKVGETNRQVIGFAEQLKQLQDVLKNPKQRGILGEYYLETVLQNVLPPGSFQMQYGFINGEIVDAAVFVKDKVVPIDSKFSLENYNRLVEASDHGERASLEKLFISDLKKRIEETSKYIRPTEGTTDFAFMFIPSEGVYYDLLANKVTGGEENLIQRAAGKYKV